MSVNSNRQLRERVVKAAEAVLEQEGTVGPLELLVQIGFLSISHVQQWRKRNPHFSTLEPHIQCGEKKLSGTFEVFFEWVQSKNLEPFEASYVAAGRHGTEELQVSTDGDAERESFFRTHFRRADISPAKKRQVEKKVSKPPDLVVYQITRRQSQCSECGTELVKGQLIFMERQQPLCLACADLDHLEFLPSGNATLTRRARKYSPLSAVVVRFSRTRKRYERQGLLVTSAAIERAEDECAGDADERAQRRALASERRQDEDGELVKEMTNVILAEFPGCPLDEARQIATHTAERGSGRVGRSAAGRELEEQAISLAVTAWIRHQHTEYDELLMKGIDRSEARGFVREAVRDVLNSWRG